MAVAITSTEYDGYRISPVWPERWGHAALANALTGLKSRFPRALELQEIGKSIEGRAIYEAGVGSGAKRVLLWSQMHGDEPTHTEVLMDLLNFLLSAPEHPVARSLLSQCRLHMIVMLNPDGAERNTRRNAQDIDVNRDARDLQTPEGRILWEAVQRFQPQFAFNLHNHNARATAGIEPHPAAVALLAPPVDQEDTENENVRRAKQLVLTYAEAVKHECPGMVARYNADYMARAFGEAIQRFGAATVLVEAGGWSTVDAMPLAQAHFLGMVRTLNAIATDEYLNADPTSYDKLPLSGGRELFDLLIEGATITNGLDQPAFKADIGVNYVDYRGPERGSRGATIVDLGDLRVTAGKDKIDGQGLHCYPGLLAYRPGITPTHMPGRADIVELLKAAVTTLIGSVDLSDDSDVQEFAKLESRKLALNMGFVGDGSGLKGTDRDAHLDRLLRALGHGLLAVVEETLPPPLVSCCQWLRVPLVPREQLARFTVVDGGRFSVNVAADARAAFELLGLKGRGAIQLGATADLALFSTAGDNGKRSAQPVYLLIGGNIVFQDGKPRPMPVGQMLRRN
ncbi:MAG: M14 family zinc carboxypeptidase [Pirellulales bacterium]